MITEKIKSCVNQSDKKSLHTILSDYLIESFEIFDENIQYIQRHINIFEKYDQKEFEKDKEKWNEDYLYFEKGKLIDNFSKERVEHIKDVIRKLYPERYPERNKIRNYSSSNTSKKNANRNNSDDDIVPKVVIGAGIVVAGVGVLMLKFSLVAVGTVVAVGGIVYKYNKEN